MVVTAFAWYLAILERTDPPLLFSLGILLENLFVVTAIHLVFAFPRAGWRRSTAGSSASAIWS